MHLIARALPRVSPLLVRQGYHLKNTASISKTLVPSRIYSTAVESSSVNATPPPPPPPVRAKRRKLPWFLLGATILGTTVYVVDLWLNDDMETLTDRWRTKLTEEERKGRPRLVILGAGWAALSMLRQLHTDKFDVTIISPRNYFLFTPLLPGTTTGTLELRSIMEPIRNYCKRSDAEEVKFIEAECVNIDPKTNTVKCTDISGVQGSVSEFNLDYDQLVVAVGADVATFNVPGVRENALFMKEAPHSRSIRDKILDCFETASYPGQPESEIDRLLHFVVVGGGPSGVEYTAELNDFLLSDLSRAFPTLTPRVRITLIEALPHILSVFDAKLIDYVENKFRGSKNIEVWTNTAVTQVNEKDIVTKANGVSNNVPYGTLVWVTGNTPRPVINNLAKAIGPENQNCRRGLQIDEHFLVKGTEGIWAMGDCTCSNFAPTAQVASQQGRYLGRLLNSNYEELHQLALKKRAGEVATLPQSIKDYPAFVYNHMGSFAYVGEHKAVAEFKREPKSTSTGMATYVLWRSVYLSKLLSIRNRVSVGVDWCKTAIFGRDISRG